MKKEVLIGFVIGLVATAFGFYIYVEFVSTYSFDETLKILDEGNLYGKVLGLAALPNLFVFFIFFEKETGLKSKRRISGLFFCSLFNIDQ